MLRHGPAGNDLVSRDEQMGNRLKSAMSAGQIGEQRIDGRGASIVERCGDDLFDRATSWALSSRPAA